MSHKLENYFQELLHISHKFSSTEDQKFVNQILSSSLMVNDSNILETKSKIGQVLDLIITFYRRKLPNAIFSSFLLEIGFFTSDHGYADLSINIFKMVISRSKKLHTKNTEDYAAAAYLGLAQIALWEGDWIKTKYNIKKAKNIYSRQNNRMGLADTENFLGAVFAEKGDITKALKQFEYAFSFVKSTKKNLVKSKIQNNLGIICTMAHKYSEALNYYNSALNDFYELEDSKKIAETLHNIGMLQLKLENYEEALEKFSESNQIAILENLHPIVGISYLGLAEVYFYMNRIEEAEKSLEECLRNCYMINDRLTIADAFKIKSLIEKNEGKLNDAEAHLLASIRINQEFKNEMNLAESSVQLGVLYLSMHKKTESRENLLSALRYYTKNNALKEAEDILRILNK
ncbi:MAG: tetratricopeptide repeat protein [Bacteroidetes bacterium]|nr:tetratricopeptide repeat protein [Bacteroidota bacterium]